MAGHNDAQGQGAKIILFTFIFYYYDYEDYLGNSLQLLPRQVGKPISI